MKKFLLSTAIVLMMGVSAFAATSTANNNDEGVANEVVARSFKKDFANARNIVWEQRENFTKATFSLNGQILFAYYNNNGDLQAVVRNITSDQLPINLLTSLKNGYGDSWITDLFEIASGEGTTYYVTLETSEKKIVLKSNGTDGWEVYSKERKQSI